MLQSLSRFIHLQISHLNQNKTAQWPITKKKRKYSVAFFKIMTANLAFSELSAAAIEAPVEEEETKADNINDAIKSVIKKSQANDGRYRCLSLGSDKYFDLHED